ncbi:hypothetical protein HMPREF9134_00070, partial [Porphyromonas catoniae F0037]
RVTISRSNELPQLSSTSYHNSFERVVVTLYDDLWQLVSSLFFTLRIFFPLKRLWSLYRDARGGCLIL